MRIHGQDRKKEDEQILPTEEVGNDKVVFTEQLLGCTPTSARVLFVRMCRLFHAQTSHLGFTWGPGHKFWISILAKQLSKY